MWYIFICITARLKKIVTAPEIYYLWSHKNNVADEELIAVQ